MDTVCGGFGETKDATEETQKICDQVKNKVEEKTKEIYEEFRAVKYRSQIVAGENFLIKVHVGGPNHLILKVHQNLPSKGGELELLDVQEYHQSDDPIVPF